jgi:hypothetical protein
MPSIATTLVLEIGTVSRFARYVDEMQKEARVLGHKRKETPLSMSRSKIEQSARESTSSLSQAYCKPARVDGVGKYLHLASCKQYDPPGQS